MASENLIWTDTCLYAMRWVPDPNVVYDMVEIAPGCGLLGPNAVCVVYEDAAAGVKAAHAAGMKCLAVTNSYPAGSLTEADYTGGTPEDKFTLASHGLITGDYVFLAYMSAAGGVTLALPRPATLAPNDSTSR